MRAASTWHGTTAPVIGERLAVKNSHHSRFHGQGVVPDAPTVIGSLPWLIVGFEIKGLSFIGLNPGLEVEKIIRGALRGRNCAADIGAETLPSGLRDDD